MSLPPQSITAMQKSSSWSKLGLGTGTLASLGRAASFSEVDRLIGAMHEFGITVIDTADSYGSGDCERLIGTVLRRRRESFTIVTKAGYRLSNLPFPLRSFNQIVKKGIQRFGFHQCFAPAYLAKCIDDSLSRLRVEHVDAFLLHNPPLKVVEDERVLHLCRSFTDSGKARLTGISSENPEVIRAGIAAGIFKIIQTPANLKAAAIMLPLWRECEMNGIRMIGNHVFDPACLGVYGMTHETLMRGSAALLPDRATILCGTRNPAHLRQACEWAAMPLPEAYAERELQRILP